MSVFNRAILRPWAIFKYVNTEILVAMMLMNKSAHKNRHDFSVQLVQKKLQQAVRKTRVFICFLAVIPFSASVFSAELYEAFMGNPEHLEEASEVCLTMDEETYKNSGLCEHAGHAIHLLRLQVSERESEPPLNVSERFLGEVD